MFLVIACPRCRRAKVVEPHRKTTTCGSCTRPLRVADLRAFARAETTDEARAACGIVNARLAGREREYHEAILAPAPMVRPAHDDRFAAAAAAARRFASEADRVDAIARALSIRMRDFGEDDLATAFDVAGIPRRRVDDHLRRMRMTSVVFEPRPARYRAM